MDKKITMNVYEAIKSIFNPNDTGTGLPFRAKHGGREQLAELFNDVGFNKGAEIGVHLGKFSLCLLDANPNLNLICVDPWMPYSEQNKQWKHDFVYKGAMKNLAGRNVRIITKPSSEALEDVEDGSLDFVYIDGNHTFDYACTDIIWWSRKVKSGGIIACHDYVYWVGVHAAVNAYTRSHHIDPWYVTRESRRVPSAFWVNP